MRYKSIVLSVFVFFIFTLFTLNPLPKVNPGPTQGLGLHALYAQKVDLVKLKKEEEERKKKTKKSKYVVTNESLEKIELPKKPYSVIKLGEKEAKAAAATAGGETGSQVATESADNLGIGTEADDATRIPGQTPREYWQGRVKKLYDDIDQTQADIKNSELELIRLNDQFQVEDIYERRLELQKKIDDLTKYISEAKQKLVDLNKAFEDLEDDARKKNIPAGWLRVDRSEPDQDRQAEQSDKKQ